MFSLDKANKKSFKDLIESRKNNTETVNKEEKVNLITKHIIDSNFSYTREQLSQILTLEKIHSILSLNQDVNSFIKLFSLSIDNRIRDLIEYTIPARELVVQLNKLPEFMQRSDNAMTEVKCQTTEIPMSDLLRQLNKNYKVKLQTPAINTLTPEKDKPDYTLEYNGIKMLFDMKGQISGKTININKIAHDRAVSQGLNYYMIGILDTSINYDKDNKKLLNYDYVTYYLLPLKYFLNNAKFNKGLSDNSKNDYYSINLKDVINLNKLL